MIKEKIRCSWAKENDLLIAYHDHEWGVPVRDENTLFEFLILEGAQAGLSWLTVLKKREDYRKQFDHFNPEKIACYNQRKITALLANEKLIRNRLKIEATVINAKAYLALKETQASFSDYLWQFVEGKPIQNRWQYPKQVPAFSKISTAMANDLKQRGFKFVGTTICYAFMQAVGMVNDHLVKCHRYKTLSR